MAADSVRESDRRGVLDLLRLRLRGLLVRLRLLRVCKKQAETAPDATIVAKKSADKKQATKAAKKEEAAAAWKQMTEAAKKAATAEVTKNQAAEEANKQVAEAAKKAAAKKREAETATKARAKDAKKARAEAAKKQAKKKVKNGADLDGNAVDKADPSGVHHARAAKEELAAPVAVFFNSRLVCTSRNFPPHSEA